MKLTTQLLMIIVIAATALILLQTLFTVDETEYVLVIQLGKPMRTITEPGLNYKLPFIQSTIHFDNRLLDYDAEPRAIITKDKKSLVVDNYSKWKVDNPLLMYQSVKDENGAQSRLDDIIYSELRVELGKHTLAEIIADKRVSIMEKVTVTSNIKAQEYGLIVADVKIKRADLPVENEKAVYQRMRAEREREAKRYRSEGVEEAQKLTSQSEKERQILLAEAYRKAETIMGEGDADKFATYEKAYKKDPQFFIMLKSLDAYKSIIRENSRLILTPDSDLLKYLKRK